MQAEIFRELRNCLSRNQLVVLATVVGGAGLGSQLLIRTRGRSLGDLGSPRLNRQVALDAEQILPGFESTRKVFRQNGEEIDVFFEVCPPPPELLVVGAVHAAIPLVSFAKTLGYRTVVIDPRRTFATEERFGHADLLLAKWPQEALAETGLHASSYLALLSHDLKIDLPALEVALRSPARYIGALGSKKTHRKRVEALRERGLAEDEIARIHAPIGLDLGGRRAEEIALAIMAEVIAVQHGRGLR